MIEPWQPQTADHLVSGSEGATPRSLPIGKCAVVPAGLSLLTVPAFSAFRGATAPSSPRGALRKGRLGALVAGSGAGIPPSHRVFRNVARKQRGNLCGRQLAFAVALAVLR